MAVACYDEAICIPTEESSTHSLRIQQIIANESGVADVVDPLGGSYYVESLTNKLEEEANKYVDKIASLGGAARAIEHGYQSVKIQEAAYSYQKEIEKGERVIVGVNKYVAKTPEISLQRVGPETEISQKKKLAEIKENRDNGQAAKCLERLREAAGGKDNIMPSLIESAAAYVTLGEMCGVLKDVFGTQKDSNLF
jgi:methylmalonyl-CoA mutase, N-terminal domain